MLCFVPMLQPQSQNERNDVCRADWSSGPCSQEAKGVPGHRGSCLTQVSTSQWRQRAEPGGTGEPRAVFCLLLDSSRLAPAFPVPTGWWWWWCWRQRGALGRGGIGKAGSVWAHLARGTLPILPGSSRKTWVLVAEKIDSEEKPLLSSCSRGHR